MQKNKAIFIVKIEDSFLNSFSQLKLLALENND